MAGLRLPYLSNGRLFAKAIPLIISLAVVILTYFLPQEDIKSVMIFILLIFVFAAYKFDSRIPIAYGVLLLLITAITTSLTESANRIAVLAFWFITVGIICIIIDRLRSMVKNTKTKTLV